ncbi:MULTISPECIES: ImmA/IrrE family metallo-endopeptidase [Halobacillus]|uniref:ImmA/IrrE family metallo-endopeptidase n=1 Tax=Halobacillus TaxID=45667 RepID=UPI0009A5917D|nr:MULTISPECIES: ImmA/IrrE family metallo-endopeptidase [Halobacillus]
MKYQMTHLEDDIKKLLESIHILQPKDLDIFIIAKRLGVDLTFTDQPSHYQGNAIMLNVYLSREELWREFAHELCHVLRHAGNQLFMPIDLFRMQESQANNFALQFCIPTFMLQQIELPYDIYEATHIVKRAFNVTPHFALRRLRHYENQIIKERMHNEFI